MPKRKPKVAENASDPVEDLINNLQSAEDEVKIAAADPPT